MKNEKGKESANWESKKTFLFFFFRLFFYDKLGFCQNRHDWQAAKRRGMGKRKDAGRSAPRPAVASSKDDDPLVSAKDQPESKINDGKMEPEAVASRSSVPAPTPPASQRPLALVEPTSYRVAFIISIVALIFRMVGLAWPPFVVYVALCYCFPPTDIKQV